MTTVQRSLPMSRSPVPRRAEDGRPSLFCDVELAARVERAEVRLIADGSAAARRRRADDAGFVIPIAGGVASFAEEGSPLNKVAGLGFDGVPDGAIGLSRPRTFSAVPCETGTLKSHR
jgi:hypothetical protein